MADIQNITCVAFDAMSKSEQEAFIVGVASMYEYPEGVMYHSPGFDAQRRTLGLQVHDTSTPKGLRHPRLTRPDYGTLSGYARPFGFDPG